MSTRMLWMVPLCAAGLWACKAEVSSVEVTPASAVLTKMSETVQLIATSKDKEGKALQDRKFTWKSSDESVAAVDATGKVTARKDGEATVTVTDSATAGEAGKEKSAIAKVSVSIPAKIEIIPATVTLRTGAPAAEVTAKVLDGRGQELTGKPVTWATDKDTVATVKDGKVSATGVGMAQLTARWEKLSGTAPVIVTEGGTDGGVDGGAAPAAEPAPKPE